MRESEILSVRLITACRSLPRSSCQQPRRQYPVGTNRVQFIFLIAPIRLSNNVDVSQGLPEGGLPTSLRGILFSRGCLIAGTYSSGEERPYAPAPVRSRDPPLRDGSLSGSRRRTPTGVPLVVLGPECNGVRKSHLHCASQRRWSPIRRRCRRTAIRTFANLPRRWKFPANPRAADALLPGGRKDARHRPRACAARGVQSDPR